jgi:hypothetical protein
LFSNCFVKWLYLLNGILNFYNFHIILKLIHHYLVSYFTMKPTHLLHELFSSRTSIMAWGIRRSCMHGTMAIPSCCKTFCACLLIKTRITGQTGTTELRYFCHYSSWILEEECPFCVFQVMEVCVKLLELMLKFYIIW